MRLTLEIPDETHRRIKTLASFNGMSMKDFIVSRTLGETEHTQNEEDLPGSPWPVKPDGMDETEWIMSNPRLMARLRRSMRAPADGDVASFKSIEDLRHAVGLT